MTRLQRIFLEEAIPQALKTLQQIPTRAPATDGRGAATSAGNGGIDARLAETTRQRLEGGER